MSPLDKFQRKICASCGSPFPENKLYPDLILKVQCDRCRAIDKVSKELTKIYGGNKSEFGYIGSNICFYCGKDITSREWYAKGMCEVCIKKDDKKEMEALALKLQRSREWWEDQIK